jgi:hypothetical protein
MNWENLPDTSFNFDSDKKSTASSFKCNVILEPRPKVLPRGSSTILKEASAVEDHTCYTSSSLDLDVTVTLSATKKAE